MKKKILLSMCLLSLVSFSNNNEIKEINKKISILKGVDKKSIEERQEIKDKIEKQKKDIMSKIEETKKEIEAKEKEIEKKLRQVDYLSNILKKEILTETSKMRQKALNLGGLIGAEKTDRIEENKKISSKLQELEKESAKFLTRKEFKDTNVGSLKDSLNKLENGLSELKKYTTNGLSELKDYTNNGLAEQAALSGLFQPVNSNTGNISASFGGHMKSVAIAIGGGYKFKNLSIRAGLSTSFKTVSYNGAINYEFK